MVLPVTISNNNVKVYHVTGFNGSSLPDWLERRKKSQLKRDPEWQQRITLIQDFEFPDSAQRIKQTRDGKHIVATGVYKPQVRVYELEELTIKFERHFDAENIDFEILSDDWTKLAFLQSDRSLEIHGQGGRLHKTRIPKFGRCLMYNDENCDMLVGGTGSQVWRLNLDLGRFREPFETTGSEVNAFAKNTVTGLCMVAGDCGVDLFDSRDTSRYSLIGTINVGNGSGSDINSNICSTATALFSFDDGFSVAAGTANGQVHLYDLRKCSVPIFTKDHYSDLAIRNIKYHGISGNVISQDSSCVKAWKLTSPHEPVLSIECKDPINDILLCQSYNNNNNNNGSSSIIDGKKHNQDYSTSSHGNQRDSGLLVMACQTSALQSYFVPELGPAPGWASFLENVTEEMTEVRADQITYDDYKFVTKQELKHLCLDHLLDNNEVGPGAKIASSNLKLVRPYMHGFFINNKLYQKAKAIVNPFAYHEYLEKRKQEKLEEMRQSRVRNSSTSSSSSKIGDHQKKKKPTSSSNDDRFKDLLENNPDFAVDRESEEYLLLHPHLADSKISRNQDGQDDQDRQDGQDGQDDQDQDDQDSDNYYHHSRNRQDKKKSSSESFEKDENVDSSDDEDDNLLSTTKSLIRKRNLERRKKQSQDRDYRKTASQLYAGRKAAVTSTLKAKKSFADRLKSNNSNSRNGSNGKRVGNSNGTTRGNRGNVASNVGGKNVRFQSKNKF